MKIQKQMDPKHAIKLFTYHMDAYVPDSPDSFVAVLVGDAVGDVD